MQMCTVVVCRCRGAFSEVRVRGECRCSGAFAEVQWCRCADVQRWRGGKVERRWRCTRGAEVLSRCRSAEVQRCR